MPSPTDDALCLRCATPLTKPEGERAIDEALELDPHNLSSEQPAFGAGMEGKDGFVSDSESRSPLEEPLIAPEDEENAPIAERDEWEFDISSAETRRLLGQRCSDVEGNNQTPISEPFASQLPMAAASVPSQPRTPLDNGYPPQPDSFFVGLKLFVAWSAICIGLMAFACGGVLLGWSVLGERDELWSLGVPITLVGQVALLVGLCFQLDRLWGENRDTSDRLGQMDEQLDELRQSTRLLGTPYHSASQNFYAHLSEGASPKMLLSDLKGQIDLLALRMSQQEDRRS